MGFVRFVIRKSPNKQVGIAITLFGRLMAALTASAIVCYSIPTATNRFIVVVYMLRNCVWQQAFERLERPEGKLSWAVLRGLEVSNDLRLPDL
jgi:hypothetical protein